jgi:hypothetical protein
LPVTSAGRAHTRRLSSRCALPLALVYALATVPSAAQNAGTTSANPPARSEISAGDAQASAPAAATDASPAGGANKEAALADEAKWLSANVPKLGRVRVLAEVDARIGGSDVATARARASSPED